MKVELHPEAHTDILEIMEFYEEAAGTDLAAEFYAEFRRFADIRGTRPKTFPLLNTNQRRANLDRFPHHIIFELIDEETVWVLSVKHYRRDPALGLDR